MAATKNIFIKIGKMVLWVVAALFILIIGVVIFINTNAGKRTVRNQVVKYLTEKLETNVQVGSIDYSLPKWINIKNVYLEDQKKDTLLFGEQLSIDLDMLKLIQGNTSIKKVFLKNIFINISRAEKDSFFNYQFIADAFSSKKTTTVINDTAEMKLTLSKLIFEDVKLSFKDKFGGNDFAANIKNLELNNNKFQPDRLHFGIDNLTAKGVQFFMNTYKETLPAADENVTIDSTTISPYQLLVSATNVDLKNIDVLVDNKITGLYYANQIGTLSGKNILYSIAQSKALADDLLLDSANIVFSSPKKTTAVVVKDSAALAPNVWVYAAKQLNVTNSQLKFDDNNKPAAGGLDVAHVDAKKLNASINNFQYSADSTTANISQFTFADKSGFVLDTTHVNVVFTNTILSATELYVKTPYTLIKESLSLRFDSLAAITTAPQNTLLNAMLTNSSIAFNDLYLLMPAIEKSLPKAQFANQYLNVNTELRGSLQRLYIPNLQLSGLSGTTIQASGTVLNVADPNKISFDLVLNQGLFYKQDLLKFVPPANKAQLANLPNIINFKGRFVGDKNNIVADINTAAKDFAFIGKVNVKNFSNPAALTFDANVTNLAFNKSLIVGFVPPATLQQINLPQQVAASGKLTGNTNNINTDLNIRSTLGNIALKGFVKNIKNPTQANYNLTLTTPGFALGKLIKQDTVIGNIAGTFSAKGTGFDYKTMNTKIAAKIASLQYNKYNYKNTSLVANLQNGLIKSSGSINDSSIMLDYVLDANVRNKYPTLNAVVNVDTIQLGKLGFVKDTLNASLKAVVNAQNIQPRSLDASVFLNDVKLQSGLNNFLLDSTSLIATSSNGIDSIVLKAPFADVHAGGAFDYDKIGASLQQYVHNYYKLPGYIPSNTIIPNQQFAIKGTIRQSPIIVGLVPLLTKFDDINFAGNYTSADTDSALNFVATMPQITYGTNNISNTAINVKSKNGRINYEAKFDTLATATNTLYATSLNGAAAKDSISVSVLTKDEKNVNWFGLAGDAYVKNKTYLFSMKDSLVLNYEKWNVAPNNYFSYSPEGIIANNFVATSDTATISIKSKALIADSPIDILVDNFNLKSISSLVNKDTVLVGGVVDINATVSDLKKPLPAFTGKVSVTNLAYMQNVIGNINVDAEKKSDNNIAANLTLVGNGADVAVNGNYYLNNLTQQFDADVNVKELNFRLLQKLSNGALQNSQGNINGNIKLDGKFTEPHYNGQLNFDTVKFALTQLGTPYKIDKQKIIFAYPSIQFPNFTVQDSLNHNLIFDGDITSKTVTDYNLNIDINADDFVVVNAKKTIASQVYGYASVDVGVSITGTSAKPVIEGDILLNDKSDVKIVLPQTSYAKNDGKTIVRFIDRDTFDINPPVAGFEEEKAIASAFAQFLNYNLNIELTKAAALTILIDPSTGDEIKVQGDARLNAGVDPGGNLVLAGTYELDNGYYDLHYQVLQRKFNLIKGSTITFAGAPLNATANITAEYIANTSSKDLLSNEVTDVTPTLANSFNQKIPYRVLLYLTGPLNKPNINFDIQLPEQSNLISSDLRTTIENKLLQIRNDPASINKQVFSLLLLGRFVSEQSSDFFKGNGGGFNDIARQSVSSFLSSALNEIASDLFKGIDIDLNLNSYNDFSNGGNSQRTDLNLAVSKSFANDRLTVSVGKNFGIEGQDAAAKASGANTGFKPDVSVGYKLTADGKYLLRAYTKNQFEVTLDGYVVETGVAFVVSLDYDKFRELFRKKAPLNPPKGGK